METQPAFAMGRTDGGPTHPCPGNTPTLIPDDRTVRRVEEKKKPCRGGLCLTRQGSLARTTGSIEMRRP